jgi:hypothetical protein
MGYGDSMNLTFVQTSPACPEQYDAADETGQQAYQAIVTQLAQTGDQEHTWQIVTLEDHAVSYAHMRAPSSSNACMHTSAKTRAVFSSLLQCEIMY